MFDPNLFLEFDSVAGGLKFIFYSFLYIINPLMHFLNRLSILSFSVKFI